MKLPGSLTVFFPAFNDAPSLPGLIATAFDVIPQCAGDFEVIVVNDGSRDNTAQVLEDLKTRHGPRLRVVTHERNQGYGAALRTGFRSATKDWVFYTDGDAQYDLRDLPLLVQRAPDSCGWVNGYKQGRGDAIHRRILGDLYRRAVRGAFGLHLTDIDCDFRLIRRDLLAGLGLASTSGTICVELVAQLERRGLRAAEVPVRHYHRLHGSSQFFRPAPLLRTVRQLAGLHARLRRTGPGRI